MAKYEYKPLSTGKRRNSNTRYLVVALLVIVIGTVMLIKSRGRDSGVAGGGEPVGPEPGNESVYVLPPERSSGPVGGNTARADTTYVNPAPALSTRTETTAAAPQPATTNTPPVAFNPVPHATANMTEATLTRIEKALKQLETGQLIAARDSLNAVLATEMTPEYRTSVKKKLTELAQQWMFSKTVFPSDTLTEMYTVRPGEMLANIGKKFDVPYEILMQINDIRRPELLQAGQKIKVIKGPFHVKVYRSTFTMDLYLGSQMYIKSYKIGLGTQSRETPAGRWRVKAGGKLIKPTWYDEESGRTYLASDPDYPLGSRWIAIEGLDATNKAREGFALHGTKEPESIGTRSSRGCIRLHNGDVVEVYNLLVPEKSEVRVVD
ncbi:MAG: L,D-transpeptidase family protein [Phycisphaerae bacterium]|nr:L,D-transpeptidase family protein [Phycisphaerae bacterium]